MQGDASLSRRRHYRFLCAGSPVEKRALTRKGPKKAGAPDNSEKDGLTRQEFLVGAGIGALAAGGLTSRAAAQTSTGVNITLGGSEVQKDADGSTVGYGLKLYKPVTEELRQTVREDFPELVTETWVNQELRDRAVEAMALSLAMSTFERWRDVPGWAVPHVAEYGPQAGDALTPPGSGQPVHLRLTAMFAKSICETMQAFSKEVDIDKEVAFIGALIHDIGKTFESDPVNAARWQSDPSRLGNPSMRHPNWGLIPATLAGLPESILHCIQAHSYEGNLMQRSLEGFIV